MITCALELVCNNRWLLSRCGYTEAFDVSLGTAYRFANRIASGYNSNMPYVQSVHRFASS